MTASKAFETPENETATAVRFVHEPDAEGLPAEPAWQSAPVIQFSHDWQGKNADSERETSVQLLWTPELLFVRFRCRYRDITVFAEAEPNGRRNHLWDRDVAEAFLQPDETEARRYKEIEVSPNGQWIDLDIAPGEKSDLQSGLQRRVIVDEERRTWSAELALPMKSLTKEFDPARAWRVNFFRVEGPTEPRFYSAWKPTKTAVPNFHVPECFGALVFKT